MCVGDLAPHEGYTMAKECPRYKIWKKTDDSTSIIQVKAESIFPDIPTEDLEVILFNDSFRLIWDKKMKEPRIIE